MYKKSIIKKYLRMDEIVLQDENENNLTIITRDRGHLYSLYRFFKIDKIVHCSVELKHIGAEQIMGNLLEDRK